MSEIRDLTPLQNSRPADWYGPDDYIEGDDIEAEETLVRKRQQAWDAAYSRLNWWQKLKRALTGTRSNS